jgi:hypothetical protein
MRSCPRLCRHGICGGRGRPDGSTWRHVRTWRAYRPLSDSPNLGRPRGRFHGWRFHRWWLHGRQFDGRRFRPGRFIRAGRLLDEARRWLVRAVWLDGTRWRLLRAVGFHGSGFGGLDGTRVRLIGSIRRLFGAIRQLIRRAIRRIGRRILSKLGTSPHAEAAVGLAGQDVLEAMTGGLVVTPEG